MAERTQVHGRGGGVLILVARVEREEAGEREREEEGERMAWFCTARGGDFIARRKARRWRAITAPRAPRLDVEATATYWALATPLLRQLLTGAGAERMRTRPLTDVSVPRHFARFADSAGPPCFRAILPPPVATQWAGFRLGAPAPKRRYSALFYILGDMTGSI